MTPSICFLRVQSESCFTPVLLRVRAELLELRAKRYGKHRYINLDDFKGRKDAMEVREPYSLAQSASIQPRTRPLKFARRGLDSLID